MRSRDAADGRTSSRSHASSTASRNVRASATTASSVGKLSPRTSGSTFTWKSCASGRMSRYESVTRPAEAGPDREDDVRVPQRRVGVVARVPSDAAEGELVRLGDAALAGAARGDRDPAAARRPRRRASYAPDWWMPLPARMIGRRAPRERGPRPRRRRPSGRVGRGAARATGRWQPDPAARPAPAPPARGDRARPRRPRGRRGVQEVMSPTSPPPTSPGARSRASARSRSSAPSSGSIGRSRCYGGGLGVLAGDILKGASDLRIPMVGVGILYSKGKRPPAARRDGVAARLLDRNRARPAAARARRRGRRIAARHRRPDPRPRRARPDLAGPGGARSAVPAGRQPLRQRHRGALDHRPALRRRPHGPAGAVRAARGRRHDGAPGDGHRAVGGPRQRGPRRVRAARARGAGARGGRLRRRGPGPREEARTASGGATGTRRWPPGTRATTPRWSSRCSTGW